MDRHIPNIDEEHARYLALDSIPLSLVLTNPNLPDNPIIYVNRAFETITGYSQASSVGRNCRFLQGDRTDPKTVSLLAQGVAEGRDLSADVLNYRADGTPFWNRLHIAPLRDTDGRVRYFMGVQRVLGDRKTADLTGGSENDPLRELTHRVKNHLAMIVSLIRMQARKVSTTPQDEYLSLARRVESLQLLYQEMSDGTASAKTETVALGAYVSRVVAAIAHIGSGGGIRTNTDVDFIEGPPEAAAQIGLIVSEILTNAYQHAFVGRTSGLVEVKLKPIDAVIRLTVRDDGIGMPTDSKWPESGSLGGRIVRSLASGLGSTLTVERQQAGTLIAVDIPAEKWAVASGGGGS